jgi:hypothetical protein
VTEQVRSGPREAVHLLSNRLGPRFWSHSIYVIGHESIQLILSSSFMPSRQKEVWISLGHVQFGNAW